AIGKNSRSLAPLRMTNCHCELLGLTFIGPSAKCFYVFFCLSRQFGNRPSPARDAEPRPPATGRRPGGRLWLGQVHAGLDVGARHELFESAAWRSRRFLRSMFELYPHWLGG